METLRESNMWNGNFQQIYEETCNDHRFQVGKLKVTEIVEVILCVFFVRR